MQNSGRGGICREPMFLPTTRCPACGYDLRGRPVGQVCPTCAFLIEPEGRLYRRRRRGVVAVFQVGHGLTLMAGIIYLVTRWLNGSVIICALGVVLIWFNIAWYGRLSRPGLWVSPSGLTRFRREGGWRLYRWVEVGSARFLPLSAAVEFRARSGTVLFTYRFEDVDYWRRGKELVTIVEQHVARIPADSGDAAEHLSRRDGA